MQASHTASYPLGHIPAPVTVLRKMQSPATLQVSEPHSKDGTCGERPISSHPFLGLNAVISALVGVMRMYMHIRACFQTAPARACTCLSLESQNSPLSKEFMYLSVCLLERESRREIFHLHGLNCCNYFDILQLFFLRWVEFILTQEIEDQYAIQD